MKIILSRYWRKSVYFITIVMLALILSTAIFCLWSRDQEDVLLISLVAVYILIESYLLNCSKRFLTYVLAEDHTFTSFSFFHRYLCTVDTNHPVYYAVFQTPESMYGFQEFIALSNEPFVYQPTYGISKKSFIYHYDMKKQIVLPYREETFSILHLTEWRRIHGSQCAQTAGHFVSSGDEEKEI